MHGNGRSAAPSAPPANAQPPQHQYVAQHDFEGTAELSTTIVHALSNVTGVDVTEAEARLDDHVDTRALDRLFTPYFDGTLRACGQLSFVAWEHRVTIYSHGEITIVPDGQQPAPQH